MDLVEQINILGPWVHGYFDLGDGVIIQDRDLLQKRRLFFYRDCFSEIISSYYGTDKLPGKTLCEVGCNAGYFLSELYKKFNFKKAVGYEPRTSNLAKARFIAHQFAFPSNKYALRKLDVLNLPLRAPIHDVVIFPSVLHHIDDHLLALRNLYRMTGEICIIDTLVLPDEVNTSFMGRTLELKDDCYRQLGKDYFGAIGYKYEDNKLDGSAFHAGIVGVPTIKALVMMLRHVGFSEVEVRKDWRELKRDVYFGHIPRDIYAVIVVAKKVASVKGKRSGVVDESYLKDLQRKEMDIFIPEDVIDPCYEFVMQKRSLKTLPLPSRIICETQFDFYGIQKPRTQEKFLDFFSKKPYFFILQTFKYAPEDKIAFECAKTAFHRNDFEKAARVLELLVKTINLDWRITYRSYHILSLISLHKGLKIEAREYNKRCLMTYAHYSPALILRKKFLKSTRKS